jgi:hypothetical protein
VSNLLLSYSVANFVVETRRGRHHGDIGVRIETVEDPSSSDLFQTKGFQGQYLSTIFFFVLLQLGSHLPHLLQQPEPSCP